MKSDEMPCIIYAHLESLIKKISLDAKLIHIIPQQQKQVSIFLVDIQYQQFGNLIIQKTKYFTSWKGLYEKVLCFFKRTRKNYNGFWKEKKMIPLTNEELVSHEYARLCYICESYFIKNLFEDINHRKVRDYCHYTGKYRDAAHSIYNLKSNAPNEIPVVFHRGSN